MSKEVVVPESMLVSGVENLHPNKFPFPDKNIPLNEQNQPTNEREKILNTYLQRFDDLKLRRKVFDSSLELIQHRKLVESNEENNPIDEILLTTKKTLLSTIILNQPDRRLKNSWEAMLDSELQFDDPLNQILSSVGNPTYGLYGIAFMPDKQGGSSPPLDVIPDAFNKWTGSIEPNSQSNQVQYFFKKMSDFYSPKDAGDILAELYISEHRHSLPEWTHEVFYKLLKNGMTNSEVSKFSKWANRVELTPPSVRKEVAEIIAKEAQEARFSEKLIKLINLIFKKQESGIVSTEEYYYITKYFSDLNESSSNKRHIIEAILSSNPPSWTQGSLIRILSNDK